MSSQSPNTPPGNWMAGAIFSLLCCWPFGIPAIVQAAKVNNLWNAGDYQGAEEAAGAAKKWGIIAFVVGIGSWIVFWICWMLFLGALFSGAEAVDEEMQKMDQEVTQEMEDAEQELEELENQ